MTLIALLLGLKLCGQATDEDLLIRAHARYREIAAWQVVPEGPKMQKGSQGSRARALAERLRADGDLISTCGNSVFDESVEAACLRFQARHGLEIDGVVGRRTLAALNVSAYDRARQIERNLERRRTLPFELGARYVLVNVPAFELHFIEGARTVLVTKIQVGTPDWPTPEFSGQVTQAVLNPSWHVPAKIAAEEIAALVARDPDYLVRNGIQVFPDWSETGEPLDDRSIDWRRASIDPFPYFLHQVPGPTNPLGRVKLVVPNPYDIYLHDTPSRYLFGKASRARSHGCIRVEKAIELAALALGWPEERLREEISHGLEQTVPLEEPLPVYVVYWTAWVDEEGVVQFREDIYGLDELIEP